MDLGALYRQHVYKKWLFGYTATSLTWPREKPEDERKSVFGVGIGFEMRFGERPENFEE